MAMKVLRIPFCIVPGQGKAEESLWWGQGEQMISATPPSSQLIKAVFILVLDQGKKSNAKS